MENVNEKMKIGMKKKENKIRITYFDDFQSVAAKKSHNIGSKHRTQQIPVFFILTLQNTVNTKYQRFGLQHAKNVANSDVLLKLLSKKA